MYPRVIPRDLFNEAKLLKCLGQLALLVHDGVDKGRRAVPPSLRIELEDERDGFVIDQYQDSGDLHCVNLAVSAGEHRFNVFTSYNSKSPYPLMFGDDEDMGDVFNDDGTLTDEFCEFVESRATCVMEAE